MRTEKHHVIPVSMDGHDKPENIVQLTREDHKLVHDTLNVPYGAIRKFRKATNHMRQRDAPEYVAPLRKLHMLYFGRFSLLPRRLKRIHAQSIRSQVEAMDSSHKKSTESSIWYWLKKYHECLTQND